MLRFRVMKGASPQHQKRDTSIGNGQLAIVEDFILDQCSECSDLDRIPNTFSNQGFVLAAAAAP
jgi:hypothetical protein